jgi:hypothetical protein
LARRASAAGEAGRADVVGVITKRAIANAVIDAYAD